MDKIIKYVAMALVGLAVVTGAFWAKSCRTVDQLSMDVGVYKATVEMLKKSTADLEKKNADIERANAYLEEQAKTIMAASVKTNADLAAAKGNIAKLEKEREGLKDKDAIIANLDFQIVEYKASLSLAIADRDSWKKIAENRWAELVGLGETVANQNKIILDTRSALEQCSKIQASLIKKTGGLKIGANLQRALVIALGAIVVIKVL